MVAVDHSALLFLLLGVWATYVSGRVAADVDFEDECQDTPLLSSLSEEYMNEMFRDGCGSNNVLNYEGLQEISEIQQLLCDEEMFLDELETSWETLPKT